MKSVTLDVNATEAIKMEQLQMMLLLLQVKQVRYNYNWCRRWTANSHGGTLDPTEVVLDTTSTDASEALAVNANNSTLKLVMDNCNFN